MINQQRATSNQQPATSAVELLDRQLCLEVVSRISGFDEKLADRLRNMVDKFQYREILKVLDNFYSKEIR